MNIRRCRALYNWIVFPASLIFCPVAALPADATAPQLVFEQISVQQGLSQSIVTNIMQDRRGFLWFGTEDGLNLYNGYGFTVLRTDPADPHSLSYNQVTALYEDRSGTIWAGTFNGGLNRYILETNSFIRYKNSSTDVNTLSHNLVYSIAQDRSGCLWIGTESGLNRVCNVQQVESAAHFDRFFHVGSDTASISDDHVRALAVDSSGNIWIGTDQGLNLLPADQATLPAPRFKRIQRHGESWYNISHDTVRTVMVDRNNVVWVGSVHGLSRLQNGATGHAQAFKFVHRAADPYSLSNNNVYALLEDDAGYIWVGTDGGGLNRYDPGSGRFTAYRNNPQNPNTLSHDEIRTLFQDRSGLLWIGTYGGGASKVNVHRKQFAHYYYDPNMPDGLSQPIIWSIYEDQDSILWIGTHGGGLDRLDRRQNRYTHYRANPADPNTLSHNIVRLVMPGQQDDLWIGTHGGGICRFFPASGRFIRYMHDGRDSSSLSHNEIRCLFLDQDSLLWIGTQGGGLNVLDTRTLQAARVPFRHFRHNPADSNSICSDYIRCVHKDSQGQFWVGTQGGGLDRLDPATGRCQHYRQSPTDPAGITSNYIFCIYEDPQGIFWLGTWGAGLLKFERDSSRFTTFTSKDGLASDAVYGILPDPQRQLWLSTNNGLVRFDPATHRCKNYNIRDGLQSNEFNGGSYFMSRSGEMFFGGINGFNAFYPEQIKDNPHIPPIVITDFRKMNRLVHFDQPLSEITALTLSHRDYIFSFEFAALDYTAPEKNQYAYKMEGLDQEWIATSATHRSAQYTTLPPGHYTFRVKGSNNDGVWNDAGVAVAVTITPPYWQTWWFRLLAAIVIGGSVLWVYRRRLRLIRMAAELRAAHEIQMAIMPQQDPPVPGFDISGICIPANQVGGDFFDYTWLGTNQEQFGIIIGDVSGKAMRAAMTAVMVSGIVYAEAAEGKNIAEALTRSNRLLYPKIDRQTFTALCVAALDLKNKVMRFTIAGLDKPLLKSGEEWRALNSSGTPYPLGLREQHTYEEQQVQLQAGDCVILRTDGLHDAMNRSREFYGEDRLLQFLARLEVGARTAREIRDAIVADVQAFTGDMHHYDDMTVIVIKVGA
jgi:ligand-binding sensor domain-containing protein